MELRLAYEYALSEAFNHGNTKALDRLKDIDYSYSSKSRLEDLLFATGCVVKYKGSLYGHKNYNSLVKDFIFSGEYAFKDLIHRQKGSLQSIKRLCPELMTVTLEDITEFPVPVILVEGRYDYRVSIPLIYQ